jgi:hypothetical protein
MPASSKTSELLDSALRAHGGVDRWNTFEEITAAFVTGGGLMPMKGMNLDPRPLEGTATIHHESTVITPFGKADQRMVFTPERVLVETSSGTIVAERSNPRATFAGHTLTTPWDMLQMAYFNGYARWTYLNTPFLLAMPGFEVEEIAPWHEGGEVWRGLRARFPDTIAGHSKEQDFYFCEDFLLRRHDYSLEIAGGVPVAQYVYDIVEAEGFRFPSKRRAYVRGQELRAIRDLLLISIDLSNFRLKAAARRSSE